MNEREQHELDWSAFRYAAGERTAPELAEFEALLASDEAAQRSLCQAVELGAAISAALGQSDRPLPAACGGSAQARRRWVRLASAGGLAASLLVACLSWALLRDGPAGSQVGRLEAPSEDPLQLAIMWSHARQTPWVAEPAWAEQAWNEPEAATDEDPQWSSEVPAWLLAAVTAGEDDADEGGSNDSGET